MGPFYLVEEVTEPTPHHEHPGEPPVSPTRARRWGMKLLRELPWLALAFGIWWAVSGDQKPSIKLGESPPAIRADAIGTHDVINTAAWRGKPLLLVFWAPWCGVCGVEMPLLGKLAEDLGENARVVGVGLAGSLAEKEKFVVKHDPGFPMVDAPDSVANAWGLRAYPTIYLLDGEGVLRGKWVGVTTPWRLRFEVYQLLKSASES